MTATVSVLTSNPYDTAKTLCKTSAPEHRHECVNAIIETAGGLVDRHNGLLANAVHADEPNLDDIMATAVAFFSATRIMRMAIALWCWERGNEAQRTAILKLFPPPVVSAEPSPAATPAPQAS